MRIRCQVAALLAAVLGISAGGTGCDRQLAPYVPLEAEPPPVEGPIRVPGLETPAPRTRVMAPPVGQSDALIRGTVRLADGTEAGSAGALFVIARSAAGGPPVAVRRLPPGPFPVRFALTRVDSMLGEGTLPGTVQLSARLDRDGNPMTRQDNDLVAESATPLQVPASGVELVLAPLDVR